MKINKNTATFDLTTGEYDMYTSLESVDSFEPGESDYDFPAKLKVKLEDIVSVVADMAGAFGGNTELRRGVYEVRSVYHSAVKLYNYDGRVWDPSDNNWERYPIVRMFVSNDSNAKSYQLKVYAQLQYKGQFDNETLDISIGAFVVRYRFGWTYAEAIDAIQPDGSAILIKEWN